MTTITLDQATHANYYGYSDVTPFEITKKVSDKTIEIRRMDYELVNADELQFHVGGFVANCSNQRKQKYTFTSNLDNEVVRLRLQKDGTWKDKYGCSHKLSDKPIRFYDYNF